MGPQIVWKILSDGNWVMMPNECENLSNKWWVMSDEWWKLSDQKNESKQPLSASGLGLYEEGMNWTSYDGSC